MTEKELRRAIAFGREQRGIEFKGPGSRADTSFQAKVIRAMLGMANKPDGGTVVLGVEDDGTNLHLRGLTPQELVTWAYDDLASKVTVYADPYIDFEINEVEIDSAKVLVIQIEQFDKVPVICKRSYSDILRDGALYVRRRGKMRLLKFPLIQKCAK